MPEDRRSAPRARLSGVRVVYESASGERQEALALDLGRGGLFVRTRTPLPVGKRLSIEISVGGAGASWPALGRIVWIREADEGEERPAGMGVKLIDVEDDVVAAIEQLVAAREPTEPGMGKRGPPAREKTMLGVGLSPELTRPTPIVAVVPANLELIEAAPPEAAPSVESRGSEAAPSHAPPDGERTGAGDAESDKEGAGREASIAIDLVSKKASSRPPATSAEPERTGNAAMIVVMLVIGGLIAAYVFRDRIASEWDARFGSSSVHPRP